MPCLILTGHPCCGKTTVAKLIAKRAVEGPFGMERVILINEESSISAASSACDCYANTKVEKSTRASLKSEFDRTVGGIKRATDSTSKTLVIFDSLNYIKGYRYELYCICKAAQERHGVVWITNDVDTIQEWNETRSPTTFQYSKELLVELMQRYEPPDERNRWDRPLYQVDITSMRTVSMNQDDDTRKTVWGQTVYNMHQTGEGTFPAATTSTNIDYTTTNTASTTTKKSKSTTFKRAGAAGFKRAARPTDPEPQPPPPNHDNNDIGNSGSINSNDDSVNKQLASVSLETMPARTSTEAAPSTVNVNVGTATIRSLNSSVSSVSLPLLLLQDRVDEILRSFLLDQKTTRVQTSTSTARHEPSDANLLHSLDSITLLVCNAILLHKAQTNNTATAGGGGNDDDDDDDSGVRKLAISAPTTATTKKNTGSTTASTTKSANETFYLPYNDNLNSSSWSPAELRRLRQQYLQWVATYPPTTGSDTTTSGIAQSFLAYIDTHLSG